jgi:hypothetical protein
MMLIVICARFIAEPAMKSGDLVTFGFIERTSTWGVLIVLTLSFAGIVTALMAMVKPNRVRGQAIVGLILSSSAFFGWEYVWYLLS